jgi:hypothetical protein
VAHRRGFLLRASTLQALVEAWLVGLALLLGLTLSDTTIDTRMLANSIFFFVPLIALWDAVRLRVPDGCGLVRHLWFELRAALALSPLGAVLWFAVLWGLGRMAVLDVTSFGSVGSRLLILAASPFFLAFRAGVRI